MSTFAIRGLDYNAKKEAVKNLHKSIVEAEIFGKGLAKITLEPHADGEEFCSELDGTSFLNRVLRVSPWEDRNSSRGGGDRGRSQERGPRSGSRPRSRSSSQGRSRGGPLRPRSTKVRSDESLVLRVENSLQVLESLDFETKPEKKTFASGSKVALNKNSNFDPAIFIPASEEKGKKKAKSDVKMVIHKRLVAVTDSKGEIWVRPLAAEAMATLKSSLEKQLEGIQKANLDCRNLLFFRFSGDAVLLSLTPIQAALAKFSGDEAPWSITDIQQVTWQQQQTAIFTVRKWNPDDVEDEAD